MMQRVVARHAKIDHRLHNGDVLIVATTKRDPVVDRAFQSTVDEVRESTRAPLADFARRNRRDHGLDGWRLRDMIATVILPPDPLQRLQPPPTTGECPKG